MRKVNFKNMAAIGNCSKVGNVRLRAEKILVGSCEFVKGAFSK